MKTLSNKLLSEVRNWVYQNARAIDLTRWQFHFEYGCPEAVINALVKYQNADGGFGHGLEPDFWNPKSSPIQTYTATEILREIRFTDAEHPVITGILDYLDSGADFNGKIWYNSVISNNDYPHAPWWHADSEEMRQITYNPSAALAGFGLCYADPKSELYEKCALIAQEAFQHFMEADIPCDMHTTQCYVRLMEYCETSEIYDVIDLRVLRARLQEQIAGAITADKRLWATNYVCKPSQFFNSPKSVFYQQNQEIADFECEFILSSQNAEGVWDITWSWTDWPKEWVIAEIRWKANQAILNMLYLKNFQTCLTY